jgi:hypothetical protein
VLAFKQKTCRLGFHDKFAVEAPKVKKNKKQTISKFQNSTFLKFGS